MASVKRKINSGIGASLISRGIIFNVKTCIINFLNKNQKVVGIL